MLAIVLVGQAVRSSSYIIGGCIAYYNACIIMMADHYHAWLAVMVVASDGRWCVARVLVNQLIDYGGWWWWLHLLLLRENLEHNNVN
jgi:hypothetical protein